MLNDIRESEGDRREWIVEILKEIDGKHTGFLHKGELVRCKDCKHGQYRADYDDYGCYASRRGLVHDADFYCADGERREP